MSIPEQLKQTGKDIEARVANLESELAQMKHLLSGSLQSKDPWWLEVAGSFEHDPTFDEAVRLGKEWRKSEQ